MKMSMKASYDKASLGDIKCHSKKEKNTAQYWKKAFLNRAFLPLFEIFFILSRIKIIFF